jgi:hypothetical protein
MQQQQQQEQEHEQEREQQQDHEQEQEEHMPCHVNNRSRLMLRMTDGHMCREVEAVAEPEEQVQDATQQEEGAEPEPEPEPEPVRDLYAPQLRVNEDGTIELDTSTLVVEAHSEDIPLDQYGLLDGANDHLTSSSFLKNKRDKSEKWTKAETDQFYTV